MTLKGQIETARISPRGGKPRLFLRRQARGMIRTGWTVTGMGSHVIACREHRNSRAQHTRRSPTPARTNAAPRCAESP